MYYLYPFKPFWFLVTLIWKTCTLRQEQYLLCTVLRAQIWFSIRNAKAVIIYDLKRRTFSNNYREAYPFLMTIACGIS